MAAEAVLMAVIRATAMCAYLYSSPFGEYVALIMGNNKN